MKNSLKFENFNRMLAPKHLAVFGGVDAELVIKENLRAGFEGIIWSVNPKREQIAGYQCYASAQQLPEAPDAAFVAVPLNMVVPLIKELSEMGAGGAVIYTAGFSETGDAGKALEQELLEAAGDMPLIGPNCYGVINYMEKMALWPFAHRGRRPEYGGAAIITQSGMMSSDIIMNQRELPMSYMVAAGNQASMRLEDFVDAFSAREEVTAIGLHIEGIREMQNFIDAAYQALENNTPIVVLKTGTSQIGKNLTISHTGSLSGSDEAYQALFDRLGIIRVYNLPQMLETLKFLTISGIPKGNNLLGFTCSGGGATMLADYAETIGLSFGMIDDDKKDALTTMLPPIATVSNPLDYTTPIWGDYDKTYPVFRTAIGEDYDVAVSIVDFPHPAFTDYYKQLYTNDATAFVDAVRAQDIVGAVCSTLPESIDEESRIFLVKNRVAPMQGLPETLNAISHAIFYREAREKILAEAQKLQLVYRNKNALKNRTILSEFAGKEKLASIETLMPYLIKRALIKINEPKSLENAMQKISASSSIDNYVLKISNAQIAHKTEWGAVKLNLHHQDEITEAIDLITSNITSRNKNINVDEFLLEQMMPKPLAELMVSIRHDEQFGIVMVIASGGIFIELLRDSQTILLPASKMDIKNHLQNLKIAPLMQGFRGGAKADMDKIVTLLMQLADMMAQERDHIAEIEINPLFIMEDNIYIVDMLMQIWQ